LWDIGGGSVFRCKEKTIPIGATVVHGIGHGYHAISIKSAFAQGNYSKYSAHVAKLRQSTHIFKKHFFSRKFPK
jgi:hypothetical protein